MVGFPGETQKNFDELKQFVKEIQFDRLGVFTYSEEEGTYSQINYKDDIPAKIKQERMDEIMALQQEISLKKNQKLLSKKLKVLIDRAEGDYYIGRTEYDSPEIDNEVLISKKKAKLKTGNFYEIKIINSDEYVLYGVPFTF